VISIEFADPAPRLSLNGREHWRTRARHTKAWRHAAENYTRIARQGRRIGRPVNVRVTFGVRDPGRRRDAHNMAPTIKAIVDGIVDSKLIADDDTAHVTIIDPVFVKGAGVRIEITPRQDTP
jgi:Holliday junction resolvase RusA-like endonuclease